MKREGFDLLKLVVEDDYALVFFRFVNLGPVWLISNLWGLCFILVGLGVLVGLGLAQLDFAIFN